MLKSRATWKIREILFRTNLNLLRVPKCYVLLTLRDQNASECKFQKQTIFFWMSGVSFMMFRWFYEKRIFPIGKRMFAISPDRIGEKSDPNLGLEWRTKYDYFARFKWEACQKNTKIHRCKNKTMNISWGFSLRIEISGKGCVYHNLPWVFNSYVLRREGEGRAKYHGGRREKKERRIQARGAKISSPAPQVCDPKGIIKDQLRGGKCLDRPHSGPK